MTEITMADLRTNFGIAFLIAVFDWVVTTGGKIGNFVTVVGGLIVFLAAFFVVGLLFLFLQRQNAW
ncbi:hypothetical protein [Haladaptatus sp. DFWS20]|uniref:hypothetical protein n=1 Tax=Haladaptatus sp. DFWS20 TaxID=3403467 RepID=UPI003EBB3DC6